MNTMELKQDIRSEEGPTPRVTARAAGVVIVDEFRTTTPRAMMTAEGYDVKQTQGVNISAPHSMAISRGSSDITQLEDRDGDSNIVAEAGNVVRQDHMQPFIRPFDHLSRSFAQQASDFREQISQRMQRNHIDVIAEEASELVEELKHDGSHQEDTSYPFERGLDTFESWISQESSAQGTVSGDWSWQTVTLQVLCSSHWDAAYMLAFMTYTFLEAIGDLLLHHDQIRWLAPATSSYADLCLILMPILAFVPFLSALLYRLFDANRINSAPRERRRFWGLIFVIGLRSCGESVATTTDSLSSDSGCDQLVATLSSGQHHDTADIEEGLREQHKAALYHTTKARGSSLYKRQVEDEGDVHHLEVSSEGGDVPQGSGPPPTPGHHNSILSKFRRGKDDDCDIEWECRVCGQPNPSQPFRNYSGFKHHSKVIPFRSRVRVVCVVTSARETNTCERCHTPWSYEPRKCAEHRFRPRYKVLPRKRESARPSPFFPGSGSRKCFASLVGRLKALLLNDVHMITASEMIGRIQDDKKLYLRDFRLRRLMAGFLNPEPVRLNPAMLPGEEVECDFRQPFHMPAVILKVHHHQHALQGQQRAEIVRCIVLHPRPLQVNRRLACTCLLQDTVDIAYTHGEIVKNALTSTIRGRPVYEQWLWVQVTSVCVISALLFIPLAAREPARPSPVKASSPTALGNSHGPPGWIANVSLLFWFICSAILLANGYHLYCIFSVQLEPPLRPRFKTLLVRLWLPPFLLLWLFATVTLAKANALLSSLSWSLALVPSYLFSLALCVWLVLAKPLYGLVCAMLTVPWILAQIAAGLWLDGQTGSRLPLAVTLLPLWLFLLAVLCWHQAMPYMWDGSLPTLAIIHWPCAPPLHAAFQYAALYAKRALPPFNPKSNEDHDGDYDVPTEGGQLQDQDGTDEATAAASVLQEDRGSPGVHQVEATFASASYTAIEDPLLPQRDTVEARVAVADRTEGNAELTHIEEVRGEEGNGGETDGT